MRAIPAFKYSTRLQAEQSQMAKMGKETVAKVSEGVNSPRVTRGIRSTSSLGLPSRRMRYSESCGF